MRTQRVRLPTGIALVQIDTPGRRLVFVARTLEPTRARLARDTAAVLAEKYAVVVLTTVDLERMLAGKRPLPTSMLAKWAAPARADSRRAAFNR